MIDISLQAVPNQKFSVDADGYTYDVVVRTTDNRTVVDVSIDGDYVVRGMRALPFVPLIPYPYLQAGNFVFQTQNDNIPYYTDFGASTSLVYLELVDLNA